MVWWIPVQTGFQKLACGDSRMFKKTILSSSIHLDGDMTQEQKSLCNRVFLCRFRMDWRMSSETEIRLVSETAVWPGPCDVSEGLECGYRVFVERKGLFPSNGLLTPKVPGFGGFFIL
jgi:hypothetical protein